MNIHASIEDTIGKTPLIRTPFLSKDLAADVVFKLESFNPMSSVKDRIAKSMIQDAVSRGWIKPGTTLIEPTSGNTGIGLAFVCAVRKIPLVLTMPDTMSMERRKILQALGATLVLTEGAKGMKGAIAKAEELQRETKNSLILGQFANEANPKVHRETTAQEIWRDTDGSIDIFVSGVGTGGTNTGCAQGFKEKKPSREIVAVEPADSPVMTQTRSKQEVKPGPHKIQGIGAGFVPSIVDMDLIDEIATVTNDQAFETARKLCREEGVMVGISSGAVAHVAYALASRPENKGKRIVAVLASHGERYLSTPLYDFA